MKRSILSVLAFVGLAMVSNAQQAGNSFDPQNARPGETVEYCHQHTLKNALMNNPAFVQSLQEDEAIRQQEALMPQSESTEIYYIPIVFHLLHNNGNEFISDDQILDAFNILNRDYMMLNSDVNNVDSSFNKALNPSTTSYPDTAHIQFVLATKAPDGTCFTGITHTVSSQTSSGNGTQQMNTIRNNNDVYQGEWAGNKYLNVYICADIGGAAGYTYTPSNWIGTGMDNGIWILHNYLGSIGTSSEGTSRALTHEVGHWLNLDHLWGSSNNPGQANNCNDDDAVNDTPECKGLTSCNLNANTCTGDNNYWGFDKSDNTENYLEYSYCSKMFTPGQVSRMRAALNSSVGGRNNVKTISNLNATGANGNTYLCKADFSADKTTICAGETVQFSDNSYNEVNGWTWTFNGGTPGNSTSQDPAIVYNTPGIYEVVLLATDGTNNDTETKTSYIRVLPNPSSIPVVEGFEPYSTLSNIEEWEIIDYGNNAEFELTTSAGHTGSNSAKLPNFGQSAGNFDELISAPVDLSGITSTTNMTLSFRYAYRKRSSSNSETLKVYVSGDCGESWAPRKTLFGDLLGSDVSTTSWAPSSAADWVTVHMTNVTSNYWVDNFRYKFEFESGGGNNLYIDDINIYAGSPSDVIVVGLEDQTELGHLTLYPNPTEGDVSVRFDAAVAQTLTFEVADVTGKVVMTQVVEANSGANLVVLGTDSLSSGMYFLNVQGAGLQNAMQFVVK